MCVPRNVSAFNFFNRLKRQPLRLFRSLSLRGAEAYFKMPLSVRRTENDESSSQHTSSTSRRSSMGTSTKSPPFVGRSYMATSSTRWQRMSASMDFELPSQFLGQRWGGTTHVGSLFSYHTHLPQYQPRHCCAITVGGNAPPSS
jgi:hypothetical protein